MSNDLLYLLTILEAVAKVRIYTKSFNSDSELFYSNDQKEFNATLNLLIAIGEESKKISNNAKSKTDFDWTVFTKLRDKLSHDYRGANYEIVWEVITRYLESLKCACELLVNDLEIPKEKMEKYLNTSFYRHIRYLLKEL